MKLKCYKCSSQIQVDHKFCSKCGNSLEFECIKCYHRADSSLNYCTNCGSKMMKSFFDSGSNNSNISNKDPIKHLETKCKVNILFGDHLKEIKQEAGGGKRTVLLSDIDKYFDIKQKIIDMYFPANTYTSLGSPNDYFISILNFQKLPLNMYCDFGTYLKSTGLASCRQALFFLHLNKKLFSTVQNENRNANLQSTRFLVNERDKIGQIVPTTSSTSSSSLSTTNKKLINNNSKSSGNTTANNLASRSDFKLVNSNKIQEIIIIKPEPVEIPEKKSNEGSNKRSRSSSLSSSYSTSSDETSWTKAQKLNRVYNKRLEIMKKSNNEEKTHKKSTIKDRSSETPSTSSSFQGYSRIQSPKTNASLLNVNIDQPKIAKINSIKIESEEASNNSTQKYSKRFNFETSFHYKNKPNYVNSFSRSDTRYRYSNYSNNRNFRHFDKRY